MSVKISHEYFRKLVQHLGTVEKAWEWLDTPNFMLGGITPIDMIKFGRVKKLEKVIDNMIEGIRP